jgi:hypothetical protein
MNAHIGAYEFDRLETRPGFLRRFLKVLGSVLSAPAGYQGGWESGARGL